MSVKSVRAQLRASGVTVEFGASVVLDGVTLTVAPGDRIGLVGPNGAGKSTLLHVLAGRLVPARGSVEVMPPDATVGLLTQELDTRPGETVAGYIAQRTGVAAASAALDAATEALAGSPDGGGDPLDRYQAALDRWLRLGGADLEARAEAALDAVGLTGPAGSPSSSLEAARLSGGEQARVGLAVLLTARYDVLLLDEPTNNLDTAGLEQLEELVISSPVPVVLVSHDRRFLEQVVTSVVEIDGHDHTATVYNEPWTGYLHAREIARQEAERRYATNQAERAQLRDRAQRQRMWGAKAQREPSDNDKNIKHFHLAQSEKTAGKVRRIERALERMEEVDKPWEPWELRFSIGETRRSGDLVAELVDAELDRGPFHLGPVTLGIGAGERVAVHGDNGQGKTTLVQALFGRLPLTSGRQRTGRSVVTGWLDQTRDWLTAPGDFLDRFSGEAGMPPGEARGVLAKFGLVAEHLGRPATDWSPGERTRAVLALFQATGVNTIVLDEPTNHLDLPAIEQLEQALGRFEGTLVLISHDRVFTSTVALARAVTVAAGQVVADEPT